MSSTSFLIPSSSSSSFLRCSSYEKNWSYQEQWDQIYSKQRTTHAENDAGGSNNKTTVIFDLHWLDNNNNNNINNNDNDNDNDECRLLLGCTSGGEVCCWKTPPPLEPAKNSGNDENDCHVVIDDVFLPPSPSASLPNARMMDCYQKPIWRRRISNGTLYSVQVINTDCGNKQQLLVVSGDDGVLVYDWNECLQNDEFTRSRSRSGGHDDDEDSNKQSKTTKKTSLVSVLQPMARFQPYKSPFEQEQGIEINSVAYTSSNGSHYLFGAAGDAFGCYKWDLEQQVLVTTYQSPPPPPPFCNGNNNFGRRRKGGGYLHTLELVPELSSSSSRLLLTGGEDGVLGIFDINADKLVDRIDMNATMSKSSTSSSTSRNQQPQATYARGRGQTRATGSASADGTRWISSCKVVNDTWWTVGGGCTTSTNNSNNKNDARSGGAGGGYIATFHAPTRSLVTSVETRECIQQLGVTPTDNTLWSVGNENVASHWGNGSPYTLENNSNNAKNHQLRRIPCTPPSLYAVAIATATTASRRRGDCMGDVDMEVGSSTLAGDPCIAVSGVGPTVDLLENGGGQPAFRFHL